MNRSHWQDLVPSLFVAAGVLAAQAAQVAWSDLAGTAVLAACLLAGDALAMRVRGRPARPSPAALFLAGAFVVAGLIASLRAPGHTGSLMPLLGLGAWTVLFAPAGRRGRACSFGR